MAISTNGAIITRLAGALYGEYLSNASYTEVSTTAPTTVATNWLSNDFSGKTDLQVANTILTNLGLTSITGLNNWLSAQLTAAGSTAAAKGAKLVSILNDYSQMTADVTYGTYATSFNAKVDASLVKSQTTAAKGGSFATADAVAITNASIALTTGLDMGASFTAGAGDDTFSGVDNNVAATGTLTSGDSLVGGAGTDTLSIAVSGTASAPSVSTAGIETLSIVNNGAGTYTLSGALMNGLANVKTTAGGYATSITGATGILNAELVSTNFGLTLGSAASAVLGDADAASITLSAVGTSTAVTVQNDGIETFNVSLTGAASGSSLNGTAVTLSSDQLETVNVTGSVGARLVANLTGADNATQTAVFNASAATGPITATITAGGSGKLSVTGGAGNDSFTISGTLAKEMTVVGGEGTDTFNTSSSGYVVTDAVLSGANVSGFEVAAGTLNQLAFPNNKFTSSNGAGTFSKMDATFATTTLALDGSYTMTRGTDTATNALTINLTNPAAATATISVVDEETLTINSAGTTSGIAHTVALTDTDLTTLTVTGSNELQLGTLTSTLVATINAAAHTGSAFGVNAAASTVAMTVSGSSGSPTTAGSRVNNITGGTKSDAITGGAYADSLVGGLGNDTITGSGGNDTIDGGNGNDVITAGDGVNNLVGGAGDDSITSGSGNDLIDAGAGNNTVVAGGGDDMIATSALTDSSNINGGTGTDRLATTTGEITSTDTSLVNAAFITISGDSAPTVTLVETIYASVDTTDGTQAAPIVLDMTAVTGVTTLNLEQVSASNTTSGFKVNNFAGTTVNLYGATNLAAEDKFTTFDGVAQASLTLKLEDYDAAASGITTVTGVNSVTVQGNSTSQFTGSADQQNSLVTLTANSVDSLNIKSTGSAAANLGAGEEQTITFGATPDGTGHGFTILGTAVTFTETTASATSVSALVAAVNGTAALAGRVTAVATSATVATLLYSAAEGDAAEVTETASDTDSALATSITTVAPALVMGTVNANAATSITLNATANDGLHIGNLSSTGDNVLTMDITAGSAATLGLGRVNLDASGLSAAIINLGDSAILSSNGATGGTAVDFDFTSTSALTVTLGASSTAKIDLTGEVVTAGTFALSTGSALTLGTGNIGAGTSSYTFTGRGGLSSSTGDNVFNLAGTKTTFNVSGLDIDTAFNISAVSATNISVTGGTGNDTVVGGTGNDTISGGAGIDSITGGVGSDVLTGGTGADIFVYRTDLESNMATDTVTKLTNVDTVNVATGDTFSFASITFTDGGNQSVVASATTAIQTVTIATTTTETTAAIFYAAIQLAITGVVDTVSLITFVDGGADTTLDGTFSGTYLIVNDHTATIAAGDTVIKLVGVTTGSTFAVASEIATLTIV